jgi:hypothetical protein
MNTTIQFKPLCNKRRNYVHKRSFHSDFVYPPKPLPFVYYVDSKSCREYFGITRETQLLWVASWKSTGFTSGTGPKPILMEDGTYRYEWNEVTNAQPGEEWLDIFRRNRAEWIEADKMKSRTATA